jgi:hypothetical protein
VFTRDGREHSLVVVVTLLLSLSRLPEHQKKLVLRFLFWIDKTLGTPAAPIPGICLIEPGEFVVLSRRLAK